MILSNNEEAVFFVELPFACLPPVMILRVRRFVVESSLPYFHGWSWASGVNSICSVRLALIPSGPA